MRTEQYNRMWKLFQEGRITEKQWAGYCACYMDKLLKENSSLFKRMKFR